MDLEKNPKPPEMVYSSGRPLTSRTRKKIEQLEDDENLALILALEEDEKIAAKIQRDLENGIEVEDYHRLNTAHRADNFEIAEPDSLGFDDPNLMHDEGSGGIIFTDNKSKVSPSPEMIQEPRKSMNSRNYESQRASFSGKQPQQYEPSEEENSDSFGKADNKYKMSPELEKSVSPPFKRNMDDRASSFSISPDMKNSPEPPSDLKKDMAKILAMITEYSPENIELEAKLQVFIPDYIPCIGDIDPMIKIPLPKSINGIAIGANLEPLKQSGILLLDEPNSIQSDPAVVDLAIRSIALSTNSKASTKVRSVQLPISSSSEKSHAAYKMVQNWVDTVADIHAKKKKARGGVTANELEALMAEWPPEIDQALPMLEENFDIAELDLSLKEKVFLCCSLLDIPIRLSKKSNDSLVDSCANLFALYSEFKNSQHFGHKLDAK